MKKLIIVLALLSSGQLQAAPLYSEKITDLLSPESVIQAKNGDVFVSEINEFDKDGDGQIRKINPNGKMSIFAKGMDDPKGLAIIGDNLYVADKNRILQVRPDGNWQVFASETAFPKPPQFLNDLVADKEGNLYVSDSGDLSSGGAIYKINSAGAVNTIVDSRNPNVLAPNGLWVEDHQHLLTVDIASGILYRLTPASGKMVKLAEGFGGGDGLVKTKAGNIYISDWKGGNLYLVKGNKAKLVKNGFNSPADIALSNDEKHILIPVMKAGTLEFIKLD